MKYNLLLSLLILSCNIYLTYCKKRKGGGGGDVNECPSTMPSHNAHQGNGYYIGFTWNNCKSDHVYICKSYHWTYGPCNCFPNIGCNCECVAAYDDCYDYKGNKSSLISHRNMSNPFNRPDACGRNKINAIANANDSNCYYSAYGNRVLVRNMKKRTVRAFTNNDGSLRTINGRCLLGSGWCPCRRA